MKDIPLINQHAIKQKFIFIHINKTGGSSVEKALGIQREHLTAMEKINQVGVDIWKQCHTFTVVRNPFDKVVSHYVYRHKTNQTFIASRNISFKQWLKLCYVDKDESYYDKPKMFMPNLDWIANKAGKILVKQVCRFENLQTDFDKACKTMGKPNVTLPHELKSARQHYREYYDDEGIAIVSRAFKKDLKAFGYSF